MSKPKVTDWIPGDQKPTIVGVYKRYLPYIGDTFSKWDDAQWYGSERNADDAELVTVESVYQCAPWRGLASDPKGIK